MVREALVRKMQGRITASHTTAMRNYNNAIAFKRMRFLKKADMNMITNPFANSTKHTLEFEGRQEMINFRLTENNH